MNVIFNLTWLIIVFPVIGLTFNAFFSTRFKEEIASYVAIAASGLSFLMSLIVLIALMACRRRLARFTCRSTRGPSSAT